MLSPNLLVYFNSMYLSRSVLRNVHFFFNNISALEIYAYLCTVNVAKPTTAL